MKKSLIFTNLHTLSMSVQNFILFFAHFPGKYAEGMLPAHYHGFVAQRFLNVGQNR